MLQYNKITLGSVVLSMLTTLFKKSKRTESKVHVYSIGKTKVSNNKENQELIHETIAKTAHKLNSLGYYNSFK
jgi:hypothetical protein